MSGAVGSRVHQRVGPVGQQDRELVLADSGGRGREVGSAVNVVDACHDDRLAVARQPCRGVVEQLDPAVRQSRGGLGAAFPDVVVAENGEDTQRRREPGRLRVELLGPVDPAAHVVPAQEDEVRFEGERAVDHFGDTGP